MDVVAEKNDNTKKKGKKILSGTVVSDKMKDTIVVAVVRYSKHAKYGKFLKRVKRYKVHDKGNKHKVGENIHIEETNPISKHKSFRVLES